MLDHCITIRDNVLVAKNKLCLWAATAKLQRSAQALWACHLQVEFPTSLALLLPGCADHHFLSIFNSLLCSLRIICHFLHLVGLWNIQALGCCRPCAAAVQPCLDIGLVLKGKACIKTHRM